MGNVFQDAAVAPDPERIRSALGAAVGAWDAVVAAVDEVDAEITWRHYRDGGWLAKAARAGRTLAWMSVEPGELRVSFHFAERLRERLAADTAGKGGIRARIDQAPPTGKLFSIPLRIRSVDDVDEVRTLLAAKLALR